MLPGHDDQDDPPDDLTGLLRAAYRGSQGAWDEALASLHDRLRDIAHREMRDHPGGYTIEATALAHEAWGRLASRAQTEWKDRNHFLAVAAMAMRGILVDEARARGAQKRGGASQRVTLSGSAATPAADPIDILDLHEALEDLAKLSERQARVVDMRYFGGLTVEEIAAALGVSRGTVDGDWRLARAWLARRLNNSRSR